MERLSVKEKVSYGLGDAANNLTFSMVTTYLLVFYTDVFGISAAAVGTLFLIARLWDAMNDPIMGAIVDRVNTNHPAGKFRPYLRWAMLPLVILAVVMFLTPDFSESGKLVYAYVTYILFGMAYTFINIPYGSLASVMTNDPVDRSSLATYRGVGSMLGIFVIGVLVIPVVNLFPDWSVGFPAVMAILGVVTIIFYLLTYKNTKERIRPARTRPEKMSFSMFTRVLKNGPFIALSIMSFFMLLSLLVNQSVGVYFFRYNLDNENLFAVFNAVNIGSMLILIPLVPYLTKKFGKKSVTLGGFGIGAIFFGALYFIPAEPVTFIILAFIAMKGLMIPNILVWAFISDVIDYGEYKSGVRQEGTTYSMYSFMRKLSQAGAGWIAGMGLSVIGYVPNADQTPDTLLGIKAMMVLLPAVASIICFLIFKFGYFLDDDTLKRINDGESSESSQAL
ncbi:glycoside-pentoside-hexuronide (GPH):cation symporter [Thalassobacillus devorans]|uniref:glycoside-pentoside-hexuronide (GPH):cation symporter n=1 Tax=Thalassobacillus devorans TaxID=279813 RepID=UPI0004BB90B9|nr:glycoside-pentoside-hexuronide (GPH):cation symporter [Thalassobacillus devorans]